MATGAATAGGEAEGGTAAAATRSAALMPQTATPSRPPGGRGRGGDVNLPAWMSNGPVAARTAMAWGAVEGGAAAGETRAITLASAVAAGRGRGRGANINLPAWMANDDGPRAAQAAAGADAEAAVGAVTGESEGLAAAGARPKPPGWSKMSNGQRRNWYKRQYE